MERERRMPRGPGEKYDGWGIIGLPFASGHALALRRFPTSSVGPGYTAIWHRGPGGAWTMYVDVAPRFACPRYFGRDVERVVQTEIVISWASARVLRVVTGHAGFHWDIAVAPTAATRLLNGLARVLPEPAWRSERALGVMGRLAGAVLRAGTLRLHGRAPNGQWFLANPRLIWAVEESSAVVECADLGEPAPLDRQARLGDFWIPQRGLLAFGEGLFEATASAARSETDALAPTRR